MKKTLAIIIFIVAAVAIAFAVLNHNKNKRTEELAQRKSVVMEVPVKLAEVKEQNLERKININGVLAAKRQVTVLSETSGQVENIYREVGDAVYQGSPLALVDATIIATQLETAKFNLANSKKDLARFKALAESGAATQQTVDQLTLAVESANSNVVALQKQLQNTTIKSPQKGVVVQRMVEIGTVVGGGSPTFTVADLTDMIMKVGLTEMEIVQVKQGMPAKIYIDALKRDFNAVINNVGIAADMSGRYTIEVLIKDNSAEKGELRPDLSGNVSFDLPSMQNAIIIPREALVDGVKDPKVYIIKDGKSSIRKIVLNSIQGSNAIIQGGLELGEQVVITGHQNLYENAAVRVIQ